MRHASPLPPPRASAALRTSRPCLTLFRAWSLAPLALVALSQPGCGAEAPSCAPGSVAPECALGEEGALDGAAPGGGAVSSGAGGSRGATDGTALGTGGSGAGGSGGGGGEGPAPEPTPGSLQGGTCYPLCTASAVDPDGDGWGWETESSCVVADSAVAAAGSPCTIPAPGGGAGEGEDCGVEPRSPGASAEARRLLCYLYEIGGSKVLSGQQETSWDHPEQDISFYEDNVGAAPAVLGGDFLYAGGTTDRAIAWGEAGGIVMLRYHMGAPPNADSYASSLSSADLAKVLTEGTAEFQSLYAKFDYAADELERLEEARVAVLFAPFHEVQKDGWFWWSKGSAAQFIELYERMLEHLVLTRGLTNLIWILPFSSSPNGDYRPDAAYYDLAGPDTYATDPPFTSLYSSTRSIVGSGPPIPLHETGAIPQPDSMFPSAAPWVLFSVWAGYQESHNSLSAIESAYASEYLLTRDELPELR